MTRILIDEFEGEAISAEDTGDGLHLDTLDGALAEFAKRLVDEVRERPATDAYVDSDGNIVQYEQPSLDELAADKQRTLDEIAAEFADDVTAEAMTILFDEDDDDGEQLELFDQDDYAEETA